MLFPVCTLGVALLLPGVEVIKAAFKLLWAGVLTQKGKGFLTAMAYRRWKPLL